MPSVITWNGVSYSIPASNELNWSSLSTFLIALGNNAATTEEMKQAVRVATTTPVTVASATDFAIVTDLSVAGAVAVNLPAGVNGQVFIVVDGKGDASTNNVTITPAAGTIGGAASLVLTRNRQAVILQYHAATTDWKILGNIAAPGTITPSDISGQIPATKIGSGNVDNTEFDYLDGVTSAIQTQLNGKQPLDSDLTAVAGLATTGLVTRTGSGTAATRTITAGSSKIAVTNGDGVAADPSIDVTEANLTLGNIGGILPLTKGGTGINASSNTDLFNQIDPLTTKGDIIGHNGTNTIRVPIGATNGQVATVDSTATAGWDWKDAGSGGSGEINAISNSNAASATTGWTAGTSHSVTRITSGSPLDPVISTAFRMSASAAATESSTSGVYNVFTLPTGLENTKLKVQFYVNVPSTEVWRVSVYDGTTRLPLSTDSSGATTLPAGFLGKFTTTFDTTANNTYTLSFTKTTGTTTNLDVTNIIVGPGIQPQGAAVIDWQSYTPSSSQGFGTLGAGTDLWWRRVGSNIEVRGRIVAGTRTATEARVALPPGLTTVTEPNANNKAAGTYAITDSAATHGGFVIHQNGVTYLLFGPNTAFSNTASIPRNPDVGTNVVTVDGGGIVFNCSIPIAEWSGSGTVNLAQNDVEYAYNTSTTDADDTTSFGYGPGGGQFGNFTATRTKRVRFLTPIQSSDSVELELSNDSGVTWLTLGSSSIVYTASVQNTSEYGARIQVVNSTDVNVIFNRYRLADPTTFGGAGTTWSGIATSATNVYRVRKIKSGQAVGFSAATTTSLGLTKRSQPAIFHFDVFNPSDLVGTTTNAAARTIVQSGNGNISISTISSGTVTLTFGDTGQYLIQGRILHQHGAAYTQSRTFFNYAGTATRYVNADNFRIGGATANDDNSGSDVFVVDATAGQTLTIQMTGSVTGSGVVGNHNFRGTVYARPI